MPETRKQRSHDERLKERIEAINAKISDMTYELNKLNEEYKDATRYIDQDLIYYMKEELMNVAVPETTKQRSHE